MRLHPRRALPCLLRATFLRPSSRSSSLPLPRVPLSPSPQEEADWLITARLSEMATLNKSIASVKERRVRQLELNIDRLQFVPSPPPPPFSPRLLLSSLTGSPLHCFSDANFITSSSTTKLVSKPKQLSLQRSQPSNPISLPLTCSFVAVPLSFEAVLSLCLTLNSIYTLPDLINNPPNSPRPPSHVPLSSPSSLTLPTSPSHPITSSVSLGSLDISNPRVPNLIHSVFSSTSGQGGGKERVGRGGEEVGKRVHEGGRRGLGGGDGKVPEWRGR